MAVGLVGCGGGGAPAKPVGSGGAAPSHTGGNGGQAPGQGSGGRTGATGGGGGGVATSGGNGGSTATGGNGGSTATGGNGVGSGGAAPEVCLGPDIDVTSGTLSGAIKIAGAEGGSTTPDFGKVFLKGSDGGVVPLADTWRGSYSARVLAGTYQLVYAAVSAEGLVPANTFYPLTTVTVTKGAAVVLDVDVPLGTVTGTAAIGGKAVAGGTGTASLVLLRGSTGDEVPVRLGANGTFSAKAAPGTYDVYYRAGSAPTGEAPRNRNARVKTAVTVTASATTTLAVDIPSVALSGRIGVGGIPGESAGAQGVVVLRDATGDEVELGRPMAGSYAVRAVPGTYDVFFRWDQGNAFQPRNTNARAATGLVVPTAGPHTLDIDIPVVDLTGIVTINGARVKVESDDVGLSLANAETGDEVILGQTSFGAFAAKVVAGRYDVVCCVALKTTSTIAPRNRGAIVKRGVTIDGPGTMSVTWDVPGVRLTGSKAIDGVATADSQGSFVLSGPNGDEVKLGPVREASYALPVVPGTYDVVYDSGIGTDWTVRTGVTVGTTPAPLDIDMRTVAVQGSLTVNGARISEPLDSGTLYLKEVKDDGNGASTRLGSTSAGTYAARVPPGRYHVIYEVNISGANAPSNTGARLGCLDVR